MLTNVPTINQQDLSQVLDFHVTNGGNLITFGPAGIGKTEMAIQACQRNKVAHIYLNLSVIEAPDLVGFPNVDVKSGKSVYAPPAQFPLASEEEDEKVLIVDEIDKAKDELQNPMLECFQFRSINGNKLKIKAVLATGNLPDEHAFSRQVSHALTNRCGVYQITHSFDAWQEWATKNGINPLIVGFLSKNSELLLVKKSDDETEYANPSPRSWSLAARDLDASGNDTPLEFQQTLIAGRVGVSAATKFRVWQEHYRHIAPFIKKLVEKGEHPEKGMTMDRVFICAIGGVDSIMKECRSSKAKNKDALDKIHKITNNVMNWVVTLPPEICIGSVKSTLDVELAKQYELMKVDPFIKVFQKIKKTTG